MVTETAGWLRLDGNGSGQLPEDNRTSAARAGRGVVPSALVVSLNLVSEHVSIHLSHWIWSVIFERLDRAGGLQGMGQGFTGTLRSPSSWTDPNISGARG